MDAVLVVAVAVLQMSPEHAVDEALQLGDLFRDRVRRYCFMAAASHDPAPASSLRPAIQTRGVLRDLLAGLVVVADDDGVR